MGILQKTKNFDYFDAFSEIAKYALSAASYLNESLTEFSYDDFQERVKNMHVIENGADTHKHEIIKHLAHEFITPVEREDIVELSQALDSVVDAIDDVMRRVYMFNIKKIRPEILEFTSLIVNSCEVLERLVNEFRNFKKSATIKKLIIETNTCENKGDDLHLEYLHRLFSEEQDTKSVLAWTTVLESLEDCCDACEDAADIIESIIMKNT